MADVDTSADAVESIIETLLGWLTGPDSGQNDGICDAVSTLRALRAERDAAVESGAEQLVLVAIARDQLATAQADARRLREALEHVAGVLRDGKIWPTWDGATGRIVRAALAQGGAE